MVNGRMGPPLTMLIFIWMRKNLPTIYGTFLKLVEYAILRQYDRRVIDRRWPDELGNTISAGEIEGDLFIDRTGFRAKLIEEQLQVGWDVTARNGCCVTEWLLCICPMIAFTPVK